MALYEEEIKKQKDLASRWNKRLLLFICGLIIAIFLIAYGLINLVWSSRIKETQSLINKGETEKALYNLDCPLPFFLNDKEAWESSKQLATNAYLPIVYDKIDDFLSKNKTEEVLSYIEDIENDLFPSTALYDKNTTLYNNLFGSEISAALATNDVATIKTAFSNVNKQIDSASEQMYLEVMLMERVVSLLNNNEGIIAITLLEEFDSYFDGFSNERINYFKVHAIESLNSKLLMDENTIKINEIDYNTEYFVSYELHGVVSHSNVYFGYYVNNEETDPTYISISSDAGLLYEANISIVDGIQNVCVNTQGVPYYISVNQNGANFFYAYEYTPLISYSNWFNENNDAIRGIE